MLDDRPIPVWVFEDEEEVLEREERREMLNDLAFEKGWEMAADMWEEE